MILVSGRQKSIARRMRRNLKLENQKDLLKVNEFAARLNITDACVRRWLLARKIAAVKVGNRLIRIPATEAQRIIEEGLRPARRAK